MNNQEKTPVVAGDSATNFQGGKNVKTICAEDISESPKPQPHLGQILESQALEGASEHKPINLKPFAKCSCGADLFNDQVTWLKKVMIFPSSILKLYNCPYCNSTKAVKVARSSAPSQATSLYDREAA